MLVELREELVLRAGLGLEAEDRLILGAGHARKEPGGILRLVNERYYQFIVWRSVLSKWPAAVEIDSRDLIIDHLSHPPLAVIEMKKWVSRKGEREIPGIKNDVLKLRDATARNSGLMIFSANGLDATDENIKFMECSVFGDDPCPKRSEYRFQTIDSHGNEVEFWVALWGIAPNPI